MLYADFYFRMKRRDAVCITGWTMGDLGAPVLTIGETVLPATGQLTHLRPDLPNGAVAFILRFDLGGEILDIENAKLHLTAPARSVAFPAASANLEALIGQAVDETFFCLLYGLADGVFAIEEAAALAHLHKRAQAMADSKTFSELPGAAVAQDLAQVYEAPGRVVVTGWMGDDGAEGSEARALIIDGGGVQPLALRRNALFRPDLATLKIRNIQIGATSGYAATARLTKPLGPQGVSFVGLIHQGRTIGTLRPAAPLGAVDLGQQYDQMRRNLADPGFEAAVLDPLLPALPDYDAAGEIVDRAPGAAGVSVFLLHDLDHWLGRDAIRRLRRALPDLRRVRLMGDTLTEALIRSVAAERREAGAAGPEVELMRSPLPLGQWAPEARHLVFAAASELFLPDFFAALAQAREAAAFCFIATDRIEPGQAPISAEEGLAALLQGQPFAAQIDQDQIEPVIPAGAAHLSPAGQMRWLLVHLAKAGLVTFLETSASSLMPGRDPLPNETRTMELFAMRRANPEAIQ